MYEKDHFEFYIEQLQTLRLLCEYCFEVNQITNSMEFPEVYSNTIPLCEMCDNL